MIFRKEKACNDFCECRTSYYEPQSAFSPFSIDLFRSYHDLEVANIKKTFTQPEPYVANCPLIFVVNMQNSMFQSMVYIDQSQQFIR
mmetsp:Transcript_29173/g.33380  ORF Transcript_29173/g.33380 Transcript_29173/m.33380 type:complete len:87 (+) Transcript_29173:64-324(+)